MAMTKAKKAAVKDEVGERIKKATAIVIAEYRGLTVADLTDLRVKLREAKAEFRICKNRIARVAIKDGIDTATAIADKLKGPIGLVLMYGDPAAAAKKLLEFAKDKENFKVGAGVMESKALSDADIKELADMPSREVMLSQIAGMIQQPAQSILNLVVALPRQVIQVISNYADTKQ
jgi:large subunit ribosomal protein L10